MSPSDAARKTRERKVRRIHRGYWIALSMCLPAGILFGRYVSPEGEWHTDPAPCQQKLEVVTYGWQDKAGNWRSYDNGERIEVKAWKPN